MKAHEQFDDLARRKLAERDIPFDTADWDGMEQLLHGRRRRTAAWWWAGALALLIAGGAWWAASTGEYGPGQVVVVEKESVEVKNGGEVKKSDASAPLSTVLKDASASPSAGVDEKPEAPNAMASGASSLLTSPDAGTRRENASSKGTPKPVRDQQRPEGHASADGHDGTAPKPIDPIVNGAIDVHSASPTDPQQVASGDPPSGKSPSGIDPASNGAMTPDEAAAHARDAFDLNADVPLPDVGQVGADAPGSQLPQLDTPAGNDAPASGDSLPTANGSPRDITEVAPTIPIAPASAWAFEFRLLGGAYRTLPNYAGGESVKWNTSEGIAPAFGAELRWGGEHLGIGLGVEHMSYRERVQVDEAYSTTTSFPVTYNFIAVDTTVLNVIDTVTVGGTLYYITQQVNTTIMVLDPEVDTVSMTTLTQQQFDGVNTVRYLEIPMFFDLRKNTGKWSFGLCAGPTLGFLIGRDSALPGATPDATVNINDQPFRGFKLGYAARVYARYQLGAKWSLGLEPALRGHFGNELKSGDLSRSSTGYGALLSIGRTLR